MRGRVMCQENTDCKSNGRKPVAYQSCSRLINKTQGATSKERGAVLMAMWVGTCMLKDFVCFLVSHWRLALSCQGKRKKPSNGDISSGTQVIEKHTVHTAVYLPTGENICKGVHPTVPYRTHHDDKSCVPCPSCW